MTDHTDHTDRSTEALNCPWCGGSGHVGDCDEADQQAKAKLERLEKEADWLAATSQELMPCPYCGSAARMVHEEAGDTAMYFVGCPGCGMYGPTEAITPQDAITAWNALPRTPEPPTKPRITTPEDWLTAVETAARGDMAGDPEATKRLDELGPAAVILRLVEMVRW